MSYVVSEQWVSVSERPWERPGWCDEEGRCWFIEETRSGLLMDWQWILTEPDLAKRPVYCCPYRAIPQPTMTMINFVQASLPIREGIAAWAAAASTAGAVLPGRVAQALLHHDWDEHGPQYNVGPDELWDAFSVVEACCAAARSIYREDPSCPMPRGMGVGIAPSGRATLVWESDRHAVTLTSGGGWSTADLPDRGGPNQTPHDQPNMSQWVLVIEGEGEGDLARSPRALAAVAASATLQQNGWS